MQGFIKTSTVIVFALIFVWTFAGWPRVFNFPPEIPEAQADTLLFSETCVSNPTQALPNSTTVSGGTWSAEIALSGTNSITFNSGTANCSATADATSVGLGHTISTAPTASEYYVRAALIDGGTIAATANQGILMNYVDTSNYYVCSYNDDPATGVFDAYILKISGGVGSTLNSAANISGMTSGDTVECRISYSGTTPTITITNITDATQYLTATDSTSPLTETKKAGVMCGATPARTTDACESSVDMDTIELYNVPPTTTLGSGTGDPAAATIAPGASATDIDSFTFITSAGTDNITQATTTFSADISAGVSEIQITSDNGSTIYGTSTLSGTAASIALSPNIVASSTSAQYKIRVVPKTHSAIPAPPGATYTATATISAWTGTNTQLGSDSSANALTIDNLSPNGATATSTSAGNAKITLNWTTSASSDFSTSTVLRWTGASAGSEKPAEGVEYAVGATIGTATVACVRADAASTAVSGTDGAGTGGCSAVALTNGQAYSYKVFQKDSNGNYDVGVSLGSVTPIANQTPSVSAVNVSPSPITLTENGTTTVTITATITDSDGCGDVLNNGTTTATLYRSGLGASCTQDFNNCYVNIKMASTSCAGTSGDASGAVQIWYIAQATDASSSFSGDTWQATVKAIDAANASSTATDGTPPELNTLLAVSVTSSINYGTVSPNATSTTQTLTITNTGNYNSTDAMFSGAALESGGNTIAVGGQKYSTTTNEFWDYMDYVLSGTATFRELNIVKATATTSPSTQSNYWAIQVPGGQAAGTYTGTTTITAQ